MQMCTIFDFNLIHPFKEFNPHLQRSRTSINSINRTLKIQTITKR